MMASTRLSSTGEFFNLSRCKALSLPPLPLSPSLPLSLSPSLPLSLSPSFPLSTVFLFCFYSLEKDKPGHTGWHILLRRDDNSPAPWEKGAKSYPCIMPEKTKSSINNFKMIKSSQIKSDSDSASDLDSASDSSSDSDSD
jgi:hypothetical protein